MAQAGAHEVARVGRELGDRHRAVAVGEGPPRRPPGPRPSRPPGPAGPPADRGLEARARDVAAREERMAVPAPATTSISKVWPSRPPGRSGVKRPWSEPKSGHDGRRREPPHPRGPRRPPGPARRSSRRVGRARPRGRELPGLGREPCAARGGAPLAGGALEDDPPAAACRVGVAPREPRAEEPVSALEEVVAREPPATSVPAEAAPPEGAVEPPQVGQVKPPAPEPAPAGGEDAEGQAQVVDLALALGAGVVGGVQEVGDPGRGVRGRDRRPCHPREAHGPGDRARTAPPAHRRARMNAVSPYEVTGTMPSLR